MFPFFDNLLYGLVHGLFHRLSGSMTRERSDHLGETLGRFVFRLDRRHRRIAAENLAHALGGTPEQWMPMACRVFENLCRIPFEMTWSLGLPEQELFRHFTIEGWDNIRNAHAKGRGVLALTGHFGNWELLTVIGAIIEYPLNIVYRPLDFKPMDRFVQEFRTRFGARMLHRTRALRPILSRLRKGELVAILLDQSVDWYEGVFVDFFGHVTSSNKGLALLAMKTKAPVVPAFLAREPGGFRCHFLPEVPLVDTGDRIKDVETNTETNTENYNRVIEGMIRRYPEQWFWVHRRWKIANQHPWPREDGEDAPSSVGPGEGMPGEGKGESS